MKVIDYLNITNVNIEKEIIDAIAKVKMELKDLNIDRTCRIYSSYLLRELQKKHILAHIVNTKKLDTEYEHYFIVVNSSIEKYIIDLTYEQFGYPEPIELINNGYIKASETEIQDYIYKIANINKEHKRRN